MKVELDKKDLVHLVCGIQPPLQMFDVLENSGLGERTGGFPFNTWEWDTGMLKKFEETELFELYNKVKSLWETITKHLSKTQNEYEYEVHVNGVAVRGWCPVKKPQINHPENIERYIKGGLLRRIKSG